MFLSFFNFPAFLPVWIFEPNRTEFKTNDAAVMLQKNPDKLHYFGLRNCGVRPRALGILRHEKGQKHWRPDLFLK